VIATIPVGVNPDGVAITPDGGRAYVANNGSNTLSIIDTATNRVVATVPVGETGIGLTEVAITPDGSYAYVNLDGCNPPDRTGNGVGVQV
jgi:YVTN family beta-propeller protein